MGIVVSTIHGAIKFHTPRGIGTVFSTYEPDKVGERVKKFKEVSLEEVKGILSCTNAEEKIIVNSKYPEQMVIIGKQLPANFKEKLQDLLRSNADVFSWTHVDMTRIPRIIIVGGKPFNTEHKLNEYKHIKPVKQKKHGLGPDRSAAACKEVEELTRARILRKVKNQTWVANPVMGPPIRDWWTRYSTMRLDEILRPTLMTCLTLRNALLVSKKVHSWSILLPNKGVEKSYLFFKKLKIFIGKKTIQWTMDAEEAFQQMKKFMEILPTLTAPIKGEVLVMYLAASAKSISVVLLTEREGRQVPIYFVSRVLQGAELNHPALEKLILALVHSARREGGSTQIEISKDFSIEMPSKENERAAVRKTKTMMENPKLNNVWKLYTDWALSSDGSGAELMLISLEGKEYTYALHFGFKTTNNEVEYEALVSGLR
ncbi:reverse transcriptase domain-containing protein [Tanacetum coccineum]